MSNLVLPLPPLAEQECIVEKVDQLMAHCDNLESDLTAAETVRTRLVDAILAGV